MKWDIVSCYHSSPAHPTRLKLPLLRYITRTAELESFYVSLFILKRIENMEEEEGTFEDVQKKESLKVSNGKIIS